MIVLSELNNIKTKQQLENIRYEAEERLKGDLGLNISKYE